MEENYMVLQEFLSYPIANSDAVFNRFRWLEINENREVVYRENLRNQKERFLYIEGNLSDKVVLVAHADTVWDESYIHRELKQTITMTGDVIRGTNPLCGIGADDRAGCAILWLLRNSGHSILITDGEEHGRQGSNWLMNNHTDIADRLNNHQFIIQFDRRNACDFKCYTVGTDKFRAFIKQQTGYQNADNTPGVTDIVTLCRDICGVNFSIGYYNEHSTEECINVREWIHTYNKINLVLQSPNLQRFEL